MCQPREPELLDIDNLPAVLTISETARLLRISEYHARIGARDGTLAGLKIGNQWRVYSAPLKAKLQVGVEQVSNDENAETAQSSNNGAVSIAMMKGSNNREGLR